MPTLGRLSTATLLLLATAGPAFAEAPSPIAVQWVEGDYAGVTTIWSEDGKRPIGSIAYRQYRDDDRLHIERSARFADGSRDDDEAVVRVGERLESISGRSRIRDARGTLILDLRIDVAGQRLRGHYLEDGERHEFDEAADIGPHTYWGPLYMLVLKNFATNARDGSLVVHSILPTPKPRLIDIQFTRDGSGRVRRSGLTIDAERYTLLPTVHFIVDPVLQRLVPTTVFLVEPGTPPSVARFAGPRNFQGQMVRIE